MRTWSPPPSCKRCEPRCKAIPTISLPMLTLCVRTVPMATSQSFGLHVRHSQHDSHGLKVCSVVCSRPSSPNSRRMSTPDMWVEYISDELRVARSEEDHEAIAALFEQACQDYLSVDIWLRRIEHAVARCSGGDAEAARSVCADAITAAGCHVQRGGELWSAWREVEERAMQADSASAPSASGVRRLRELYQRQLRVPLVGNDAVLASYVEWEASLGEAAADAATVRLARLDHDKASAALALRQPLERVVATLREAASQGSSEEQAHAKQKLVNSWKA